MATFLEPLAQSMFRTGWLRKPLVVAISAYYRQRVARRQHFSIGPRGHWLNEYAPWTIASQRIHTTAFPVYRERVLDNWCFEYTPRPADVVIDVGAGVGEEAVVFSDLVGPTGQVISIEAHPATFACLEETVRLSRLENVVPLAVAVSDSDGSTTIADGYNYQASSIVTGEGGRQIPMRSLDSLANELGLGEVALLKMNIEGAEGPALDGMHRLAKRLKYAVISCHDFLADRGRGDAFRTFERVLSRLHELGFETRTRPDDPRPWTRYYIYARNRALI